MVRYWILIPLSIILKNFTRLIFYLKTSFLLHEIHLLDILKMMIL